MRNNGRSKKAIHWMQPIVLVLVALAAACQLPATAVRRGRSAEAQLAAGDKAMEQRRYDDAARHYDTAERAADDTADVAPHWVSLATVYESFGHDTGNQYAHRYYKRAIKADPHLAGPRLARARMLLARTDPQQMDLDVDRIVGFLDEEEQLKPGRPEVASLRKRAEALRSEQLRREPGRARAYANAARMGRPTPVPTGADENKEAAAPITASAAKAVGNLTCSLQQFSVLGAPSPQAPEASITAVRLQCSNSSRGRVRLEADRVRLIDSNDDQFAPDNGNATFHLVFDEPTPQFVKRFRDIKRGETVDLGFTFETDYDRSVDVGLRLDVDGTTFGRSEAPR